jgi:hypothetical protein
MQQKKQDPPSRSHSLDCFSFPDRTVSHKTNHKHPKTEILISPLAKSDKIKPSSLPSPSNTPLSPIQVAVNPKEVSESNSTSSPTTSCISSISSPTAQYFPKNLDVAEIGSLAVENHEVFFVDTQIAPEYSQETLDYYNDIQDYFQHLKMDGTEKKKKKKKKKTINSGSDSSIASSAQPVHPINTPEDLFTLPPADVPTAAIGALTVMNEETLATLERQNVPCYRPIEDSDFVPFEDW